MESDRKKILVVEDDQLISNFLKFMFKKLNYEQCGVVSSGEEVFDAVKETTPDLITLDITLDGEMTGFDVARQLYENNIFIPIIYVSSEITPKKMEKSKSPNVYGYLVKPIDENMLYTTIELALSRYEVEQKLLLQEEKLNRTNEELRRSNEELETTNASLEEVNNDLEESEERFRLLAENSSDIIYRTSLPDGKYEYVSPAIEKLFGHTPDEFYQNPLLIKEIIHPDWQDYFEKEWRNLLVGKMPPTYEYQIIHKSGEQKWLNQRNALIWGTDGKPIAIQGVITDITERKKIELALEESHSQIKDILESISDGFFSLDDDFVVTYFNTEAENILGKTKQEVLGKKLFDVFPEARGSVFEEKYSQAINEKKTVTFEAYFDVEPYANWYLVNAYPKKNGISVYFQVITEIKESQKHYRLAEETIENADISVFWTKEDGSFFKVNQNVCDKLGYTREELLAMNISDIAANYDPESRPEFLNSLRENGSAFFNVYHKSKNGKLIPFEISSSILQFEDEEYEVAIATDITDRKKAEDMLKKSEERYKLYIDNSPLAFFIVDKSAKCIRANRKACEYFGYTEEEFMHLHIPDVLHKDYREKGLASFRKCMSIGKNTVELKCVRKDKSTFFMSVSATKLSENELMGFCQDITERIEMEKELKEGEELYRNLFDGSRDGIVFIDTDGKFADFNQSFLDMLGYTKDELLSMDFYQITPEKWHKIETDEVIANQLMTRGYCDTYEKEYIKKDGTVFPVELTSYKIELKEKNKILLWGVARDITERKKAEKIILDERNKFKGLIENAPLAIIIFSFKGEIEFINNACTNLTGYVVSDVKTVKSFWHLTFPDDDYRKKIQRNWRIAFTKPQHPNSDIEPITAEIVCKNKEVKTVKAYAKRLGTKYIVIIDDITLHIEYEQKLKNINMELETKVKKRTHQLENVNKKLKQSEEFLNETGKLAKVGGWEYSLKTEKLRWTEEVYRIHEVDFDFEPTVDKALSFYTSEDVWKIKDALKNIIEYGKAYDLELKIITAEGNNKWVRTTGQAEFEGVSVAKIKGIFQDITDKKEKDEEIQKIIKELEKSNRELSNFTSVVSHDLKSPLNIIIRRLEMINEEIKDIDETTKDTFGFVVERAKFMQKLINNLLGLARLDTKKEEHIRFNFKDAIQEALENLGRQIELSSLQITINELPKVQGDWILLIRLMQNLIENAFKYNDKNVPKIDISAEDNGKNWLFKIKDNGVGLPESALEKIFELFSRYDIEHEGTGIGLATCKKIVEIHGGKIFAQNNPDEGSTFFFTLPKM